MNLFHLQFRIPGINLEQFVGHELAAKVDPLEKWIEPLPMPINGGSNWMRMEHRLRFEEGCVLITLLADSLESIVNQQNETGETSALSTLIDCMRDSAQDTLRALHQKGWSLKKN